MRRAVLLSLMAAACSSELEPGLPRVAVRQVSAAAPGQAPRVEVRGDRLIVAGHYSMRYGCRRLSGHIEQKPGALRLAIVGSGPLQRCAEDWSHFDYEVLTGPLPAGTYQLTVVHVAAERSRRPLPIVLRRNVRIE
jgi:hypothetical protein